ncbi:MAG: sortase [Bacilli bacterium]|nr:sortase [Bacilli bacterium]
MEFKKLKIQVASGVILILVGITFLLHNYIVDKREEVFSSMNIAISEELAKDNKKAETTASTTNTTNNNEGEFNSDDAEQNPNYQSYVGELSIPKIGFQKGFYAKESSLNNVKFNIKILEVSSYPDEEGGNVIIIGHSGNYSNSYFANLYQLGLGDMASINYKNKKYNYKIVNIYTDTKDGTVTIYRDETKNTMTLITCTKDDETKQTIYILELDSVE